MKHIIIASLLLSFMTLLAISLEHETKHQETNALGLNDDDDIEATTSVAAITTTPIDTSNNDLKSPQQQQQPQDQQSADHNHLIDLENQFHNDTILAEAYLFGSPEHEVNFERAYEILKRLSENGNPTAHLYLGFMFAAGLGVKPSQSKALIYYTFAAACDNLFAKMALAYRYWSGISVHQSCEASLKYYRVVARKVEEEFSFSGVHVIHRVRLYDEHENPSSYGGNIVDDDIIQYYQFLADKGDIQAQVGLGQLHFQGSRGVEQDHQKALFYFQKAAESGNTNAMAYLGKIYLDGSSAVDQDTSLAFEYFKKAADQENPVAQSGLGLMYLQGKGVEKDYKKAFEYFEAAAKKNWVDGHLQLGIMYHKGLGVKKDYRQALKYFQLASQSGHVLGFYNLAQMHATGTGTLRDCRIAVELLKNVAERGHWGEKFMQAYQDHREGNPRASFVKYAFLSELGYEVAQSNAAFILDREELSTLFHKNESYRRALMYWARSASQGYVMARVKLGDHHYYGQGTKVDYEAAASHYMIASDQLNNAQAFFNLGYMHERGLGLTKDIHLARRYYDLAAEASDEAQVPVTLVKMKLRVINFWNSLNIIQFLDMIGEDWDVYVITILLVMLAGLLVIRR